MFARIELGLPFAEFYRLSPRVLCALTHRHRLVEAKKDLRAAVPLLLYGIDPGEVFPSLRQREGTVPF